MAMAPTDQEHDQAAHADRNLQAPLSTPRTSSTSSAAPASRDVSGGSSYWQWFATSARALFVAPWAVGAPDATVAPASGPTTPPKVIANATTVAEVSDELNQLATSDEIERVFHHMDADANGQLSRFELAKALMSLGVVANASTLDDLLLRIHEAARDNCDDDDKSVSLTEFRLFYEQRQEQLWEAFRELQHQAQFNGKLTAGDLRLALYNIDMAASDEEISTFISMADVNHDGAVQWAEFRDFLLLLPGTNVRAMFDEYWRLSAPFIESTHPEWSLRQHFVESVDGPPAPFNSGPTDQAADTDSRANAAAAGHACRDPQLSPTQVTIQLLAGGIAGAVSRSATAPIDRIRLMMQAGTGGAGNFIRVWEQAVREEGWLALWRGNGVNCIKIAPETSIRYATFDILKRQFAADPFNVTVTERFVAGGMAGAASQMVIYPLEIARVRLALAPHGTYNGLAHCLKKVAAEEGWRSLFSGLRISIIGIIPFAGIDLASNSLLRDAAAQYLHTDRNKPSVLTLLGCGVASSSIAMLATFPLGLVRTRLQASGMPGADRYDGFRDAFNQIRQQEGWRGFYRGVVPTLLKAAPAASISYTVYGLAKQYISLAYTRAFDS